MNPGDGSGEIAIVAALPGIVENDAADLLGVFFEEGFFGERGSRSESNRRAVRPSVGAFFGAVVFEKDSRLGAVDLSLERGEGQSPIGIEITERDCVEFWSGCREPGQRLSQRPGEAFGKDRCRENERKCGKDRFHQGARLGIIAIG